MTLRDQHGLDVLQTLGIDRDRAATEEAALVYSGTSVHPVIHEADSLTLRVEGNDEASAQLTIYLTYATGV